MAIRLIVLSYARAHSTGYRHFVVHHLDQIPLNKLRCLRTLCLWTMYLWIVGLRTMCLWTLCLQTVCLWSVSPNDMSSNSASDSVSQTISGPITVSQTVPTVANAKPKHNPLKAEKTSLWIIKRVTGNKIFFFWIKNSNYCLYRRVRREESRGLETLDWRAVGRGTRRNAELQCAEQRNYCLNIGDWLDGI